VKNKGQILKVGSHSNVQNSAQSPQWPQILGYNCKIFIQKGRFWR